jgi:uncharacterized Rmd1/YagE family protein
MFRRNDMALVLTNVIYWFASAMELNPTLEQVRAPKADLKRSSASDPGARNCTQPALWTETRLMTNQSDVMADRRIGTVRALLLSDRIETAGLERSDVLSTTPLAVHAGKDGIVVLFRYGVAVFIGMSSAETEAVLESLRSRLIRPVKEREEEVVSIEISEDKDEHIPPGGPISLKTLTPQRALLIADALAKSVVLERNEREVAAVFDVIEPFARHLAEHGRTPVGRRAILKHIGNALLVQHRVSGRVAVAEKPDVLWDRPDLERLYARLEDEYELKERTDALSRKLAVIAETAKALTDINDTERSTRLEQTIVVLILLEIIIAAYQILAH